MQPPSALPLGQYATGCNLLEKATPPVIRELTVPTSRVPAYLQCWCSPVQEHVLEVQREILPPNCQQSQENVEYHREAEPRSSG
eukprot:972755-Amphidinium_carterae.1